MRNMSFSLTTPQFLGNTKTVTRRLGWWHLKPGDRVQAVEKAMGLRRGEKIKPLGVIEILSVRPERIHMITDDEVVREGFPELDADEFIDMFCAHMRCTTLTEVNRIEFRRLS